MTTTDSSTPCSTSAPADAPGALPGAPLGRRAVVALLAGGLVGLAGSAAAEIAASVTQLRLEEGDDGVFLSAAVQFELPPGVGEVLEKGIAIYFVAEAELFRERWYWADRRVADATRHMRLAYQPLSRRWRLNTAPQPISNSALGFSLNQNFDSLNDALDAVRRVARLRLGDRAELGDELTPRVAFSFRLDTSQLPRPFQIGVAGQGDWNLVAQRSARLPLEKSK